MKYICVLWICVSAVECVERFASTRNGLVRGLVTGSKGIVRFLGIPYGEVDPEHPFSEAQDVPPFQGVYSATNETPVCPQQDDLDYSIVGTLDCLRINVYVPNEANPDNRLPVMVFIHGGDFRRGNSYSDVYGPDFLVTKGVLLVTFNYRLGPYGFMSINRADIPGNTGLRDQLKALHWIKDNIAGFGGDENNITLFGVGAGAASVEVHMLSEHAKHLFHKAILQSGSILCDWVMIEPDTKAPIKLAEHLGLVTDDINDAIHYLSKMNPHDVIRATFDIGYIESFKPIVEHNYQNVKSMIRNKPSNLLKETLYSLNEQESFSKPVIIGFNSREEHQLMYDIMQSSDDYFEAEDKSFRAKFNKFFHLDEEELDEAEDLAKHFYIGNEDIGPNSVNEMLEFNSDFSFIYPILRDSRYYLQFGNVPLFLYMFDYDGHRNYMKNRLKLGHEIGAIHGDEIGYLFKQSYQTKHNSLKDTKIIGRMTTMWTNFAKTSNPTPELACQFSFKWEASTVDPFLYALLNDKFLMMQHPFYEKMAFWDNFFTIYGEKARW